MDGLECSEIMFSQIDLGDRFDSDYYTKNYLHISALLATVPTKKLGKLATTVASAFYPAATQLYSEGDTAFARCVDCVSYPIITSDQDSKFEKIPSAFGKENKGIAFINTDDIIITKVGTPCYASILTDYDEIALSRTVMGLTGIHGVDPYYLMVFLRSKYGFEQLFRQRELTIQYQLTLPRVKTVDVFLANNDLQQEIKKLCKRAKELQRKSRQTYYDAEKNLMSELGLNLPPINNTISVEMYSNSIVKTGRIDAEYYQPQYKQTEKAIFAYDSRSKRLSEIATYLFTGEYSEEYHNETDDVGLCQYIRGTDISNGQIEHDSEHYVNPQQFSKKVSQGDILTGRVGTIGNFGVVDTSLAGAVCSDNILCFHLPSRYSPNVYALYFNCEVIKSLIVRLSRGSVQQRLNQETIKDVLVPFISEEIQAAVDAQIIYSFTLRKKSKQLLEYAKQAVEMAIEQGEDIALKWLEDKLLGEV